MDAGKVKTGTERARVSSGASSSDSEERIVPVTISLDFDPVEFQAAALKTISKYGSCASAYVQWRNLPGDLKEKLVFQLDTTVLRVQQQEAPSSSWTTWTVNEMEDFREGVRMKLLIGAFEEYNSENKGSAKAQKTRMYSDQSLRMDIKIATYRLAKAMTTLLDWAERIQKQKVEKRTNQKAVLEQKSLITFVFSSSSRPNLNPTSNSMNFLNPKRTRELPRTNQKQRLEEDKNRNAESPPLSLYSSDIWEAGPVSTRETEVAEVKTTNQVRGRSRTRSRSGGSSDSSLGEWMTGDEAEGSLALSPSGQSHLSLGEERINAGKSSSPETQLYDVSMGLVDLNENKKVLGGKKREAQKKRTRAETTPTNGEESGESWVTTMGSSSTEEEGNDPLARLRGSQYKDMDDLEVGDYLREYRAHVGRGSRLLYVILCGTIFITVGFVATIAIIFALFY